MRRINSIVSAFWSKDEAKRDVILGGIKNAPQRHISIDGVCPCSMLQFPLAASIYHAFSAVFDISNCRNLKSRHQSQLNNLTSSPCWMITMPKTGVKYSGLGSNASPVTRKHVFIKDIVLAFAVSVLPLLAFSGLLLGLLFWYRVIPHGHNDPRLPDENPQKKGIVFISLSATVFTTVGSWSSTVAPLSLPFILTIASYPASRLMMRASDGKEGRKLPTPYQIALILRVMSNSSLSSVWQCMNYISAKRSRAPMSSALNIMMCTLVLGTIQR